MRTAPIPNESNVHCSVHLPESFGYRLAPSAHNLMCSPECPPLSVRRNHSERFNGCIWLLSLVYTIFTQCQHLHSTKCKISPEARTSGLILAVFRNILHSQADTLAFLIHFQNRNLYDLSNLNDLTGVLNFTIAHL